MYAYLVALTPDDGSLRDPEQVALTPGDGPLRDPEQGSLSRRASRGVLLLLIRYFLVQLVGLAANIALSRLLSPQSFGIYAITLVLLVLFSWISDFGLGAALLQRRAALTQSGLATVFTVQQLVLGVLVVATVVAAGPIAATYRLGPDGVWFIRAMAFGGFLSSLKTVPTIVMERRLLYGRLTTIEVVEVLVFQLTAVGLAFLGFGTWSFIVAVLVSKFIGFAISLWLAGWTPGIALDRRALVELLSFALPFQVIGLTNLGRDYMIPIMGGLLISTVEVGYLNWALALTAVPAQMAQVVGRVAFPSFSRMQTDVVQLGRAVDASVRALFVVAVPTELMLIALGPWLIEYVFSPKWEPALVPLYLLGLTWAGVSLTTPLVSVLNATGRVRASMVVGVAWTLGTIVIAAFLVARLGYIGFAVAMLVTRIAVSAILIVLLRPMVPLRLWEQTRLPFAVGAAVAVAGALTVHYARGSLLHLGALAAAMGFCYLGLLWVLEGSRLRDEFGNLVNQLGPVKR